MHQFQTSPAPYLSNKYVVIDTNAIISMMTDEGFYVAAIKRDKPRKLDVSYARHQVDFRPINAVDVEGYTPRLLFTNSFNGTSGANSMIGVYRFVCSNGLVVGSTYARTYIRHIGEPARNILKQARSLAQQTSRLFSQIEEWKQKQLPPHEVHHFAIQAMNLRFGIDNRYNVDDVLLTRRTEDEGQSLWNTFNRVQENISRGGLLANTAQRTIRSRQLRSITLDTAFNASLWRLAESYV